MATLAILGTCPKNMCLLSLFEYLQNLQRFLKNQGVFTANYPWQNDKMALWEWHFKAEGYDNMENYRLKQSFIIFC